MFSEKIAENIPTSCDLKFFFYALDNNFKHFKKCNDIVSSFDIISWVCIVIIDEITKFEI